MRKYFYAAFYLLLIIIFISCAGRRNTGEFIPVPDGKYFEYDKNIGIGLNDILESKGGALSNYLPAWLSLYIIGGLEAVESLYRFNNKYVFIAVNEGDNFTALSRWTENFSAEHDIPMLAAERVEKKMISSASLYPDDEYGLFFERMVKSAHSSEYPGAVKEDTYWIKTKTNNQTTYNASSENVMFFVLLSIEKETVQSVIGDLAARTASSVSLTRNQAAAVNRLRQTFFEGF